MDSFEHLIRTIFAVLLDIVTFTRLCLRTTTAVAAENLFLRKQLDLLSNDKSNHDGLPILSDSLLPDSPAALIGETP